MTFSDIEPEHPVACWHWSRRRPPVKTPQNAKTSIVSPELRSVSPELRPELRNSRGGELPNVLARGSETDSSACSDNHMHVSSTRAWSSIRERELQELPMIVALTHRLLGRGPQAALSHALTDWTRRVVVSHWSVTSVFILSLLLLASGVPGCARGLPPSTLDFPDFHPYLKALACSPDGNTAVTGCGMGILKVWDLRGSMALVRQLKRDDGIIDTINALAYSHDGAHVAVGYDDGTLRVFRTDRWEMVRELPEWRDDPLPGLFDGRSAAYHRTRHRRSARLGLGDRQ